MSTDFVPLLGRAESVPPYYNTVPLGKEGARQSSALNSSLQQMHLAIAEAALPLFEKQILSPENLLEDLNGRVFSSHKIINSQLIRLAQKTAQIRSKTLLMTNTEKKLQIYLHTCQKKLQEQFHQVYLNILQEQAARKKTS